MQFVRSTLSQGHGALVAIAALACGLAAAAPASAATLDTIKESGHIKLGYVAEARPFTFSSSAGAADGFGAALCQRVAETVKTHLGLTQLTVDWVAVPAERGVTDLQGGAIDLLCTPSPATLSRRAEVAFSIPVFPGGVRAIVRADAPAALKDALAENPDTRPTWRGSPAAKVLSSTPIAVVAGSTTEVALKSRLASLGVAAKQVSVPDYATGLKQVKDGTAAVFLGDRAAALGAMGDSSKDFVVVDRLLTHEPYSLALRRNDDDFRLVVDSALTQGYATKDFGLLYTKWFGSFDDVTKRFFSWNTLQP